MARTVIPVLNVALNSANFGDLRASGVELSAFASHGGLDGNGYKLLNPTGKTILFAILDGPTRARGRLTLAVQPTANDTITLDMKVFTYKASAVSDGDIAIGATLAATQANTIAAVNGTDGINTPHTTVTAGLTVDGSNHIFFFAIAPGTGGNSIASTKSMTSGSNVFDAATLGTSLAGGGNSDATITVVAVADPYGRGGPSGTPTYNLVSVLDTDSDGFNICHLNGFSPQLYNQTDGTVSVDVSTSSGVTGRLVAINL